MNSLDFNNDSLNDQWDLEVSSYRLFSRNRYLLSLVANILKPYLDLDDKNEDDEGDNNSISEDALIKLTIDRVKNIKLSMVEIDFICSRLTIFGGDFGKKFVDTLTTNFKNPNLM